jgi:hypothetical protein
MEHRSTQAHPGAPAEGTSHIQMTYNTNFLYLLRLENESSCRMRAEAYTEGEEVSTAARLCRENRREAGVKSYTNYKKR